MRNDSKQASGIFAFFMVTFFGWFCVQPAWADELVYTPINPSFGGSPLNGTWLLGNSQAQNTFEDPAEAESEDLAKKSDLDNFNDTLERIALSRIASQLVSSFLDGDANYLETGNLILEITEDPVTGKTTIKTTDKGTGDVTIIDLGFTPK